MEGQRLLTLVLMAILVSSIVFMSGCVQEESPTTTPTPEKVTPTEALPTTQPSETLEKESPTTTPTPSPEKLLQLSQLPSRISKHPLPLFGGDAQHTFYSPYVGYDSPEVKWLVNVKTGDPLLFFFLSSGYPFLIAEDGTLYVNAEGEDDTTILLSIGPRGENKWAIKTFASPLGISPDGDLYAKSGGSLLAFSPEGVKLWEVKLGGVREPINNLVIGKDGTLYVTIGGGPLFAVNPDGTIRWTIRTESIFGPAIGQDDTIVISSVSGTVLAYDTEGQLKWSYSATLLGPSFISIGSDGTIYLLEFEVDRRGFTGNLGRLIALSPDGQKKWDSDSIGILPRGLPVLSPEGPIFIQSADGLYKVSSEGDKEIILKGEGPSQAFDNPMLLAIDRENTLYLSGYKNGFLTAIKPDGTIKWSLSNKINEEPWEKIHGIGLYSDTVHKPSQIAIGSDGTIYYASGDYVGALGKQEPSPFTHIRGKILFAWTPLGHEKGYCYVMNPDGTGMKRILERDVITCNAIPTLDGTKLLFRVGGWLDDGSWRGTLSIESKSVDGSERKLISLQDWEIATKYEIGINYPVKNQEEQFIFKDLDNQRYFVANLDGTVLTYINFSEYEYLVAPWFLRSARDGIISPDGTKRIFVKASERDYYKDCEIWIGYLDTETKKKIVDLCDRLKEDDDIQTFAWSPDGTKIIFSVYRRAGREAYIANADGSDLTLLMTEESQESQTPFRLIAWVPEEMSTSSTIKPTLTIKVKREAHGDGQIETLNLENEYLPVVVASENANAPYESLKTQAVAARSFALYKKLTEPQSNDYDVLDSEADQVYNPSVTVTSLHQQAVKDTEGIVLKYKENVVCAFYVSGTGGTEGYLTYNEGKKGDAITQTSLGWVTDPPSKNPYNRGAMGQVQANELASNGYGWQDILRYFYGEDIEIGKW